MMILREFEPADRYLYDFGPCSVSRGFAQVDTGQDAWYFGTWANPTKLIIINYCEGDVTTTQCENDAEFRSEIERIAKWNIEQGWGKIRIDPGLSRPELRKQFEVIGLGELMQ